jgi:hypothetical protein
VRVCGCGWKPLSPEGPEGKVPEPSSKERPSAGVAVAPPPLPDGGIADVLVCDASAL